VSTKPGQLHSTGAALAYLKNRRPDRWRDRQIVEHQQRTPYDGIETAAELRALLQKQAQQLGLIPPPVINITPQQGVTDQKATDEALGNDIER
jgi:hypothetical protein